MSEKKSARLELNRETVRELTGEELVQAGGARVQVNLSLQWGCLPSQAGCTGYYPSWNAPCTN